MPAARILDWKGCKSERPILHNSKSPENLRRIILEYIKNIGRIKYQRGPTKWPQAWGHALPPRCAPRACGPPGRPLVPIFCYMMSFDLEKNKKDAFGTKRRHLETEPGQKQSRAPAELLCRGNFPPGGENPLHHHHQ